VAMGREGLRLDADGRTLLSTDAPVVLRKLEVGEAHLACETHSERVMVLRLQHPAPLGGLEVDGVPRPLGGSGIELSPGIHSIRAMGTGAG